MLTNGFPDHTGEWSAHHSVEGPVARCGALLATMTEGADPGPFAAEPPGWSEVPDYPDIRMSASTVPGGMVIATCEAVSFGLPGLFAPNLFVRTRPILPPGVHAAGDSTRPSRETSQGSPGPLRDLLKE